VKRPFAIARNAATLHRMIPGSVLRESGGFRWQRWYAVPVVVAALVADYASPAELWTAYIPLAFMAVLLTFRERVAALAVLFLSSWILLPAAAGVTSAFESSRGARILYGVQFAVPGVDLRDYAHCYEREFTLAPLVDEGGENAAERTVIQAVRSFAALHNQLAIWHAHGSATCEQRNASIIDSL
jgi:hypothetical protein